ncbi:PAX3- and PAX7-binding protein 1 [Gadus chalcogrammus]|uniref:PAX3- and PAX7-binding protein 1 n=1 Tax=Gadus chalcogrammus TaxID=1042646 RepID=UPI0024C2ECB9|nr:PAX3- and PAX7-binding protein 1 [Gadus chalcogrammus]
MRLRFRATQKIKSEALYVVKSKQGNNQAEIMFKKAKRANLRRRNDSDEDEQPSTPAQTCGPVVEEIPFMETSFAAVRAAEIQHGNNGFQYNNINHNLKPIKKEKKFKEICPPPAAIAAPSKASLLSFDDDEEGSEVFRVKKSNYSKKIVKQLKKEYKEDLEKTGPVKQEPSSDGPLLPPMMIKEEPRSTVGGDQGVQEMELDGIEVHEEEAPRGLVSQGHAPVVKGNVMAGSFNTLSSLSSLRPGEIPDAAFIHAARKRRQLARELGGEPPLVETDAPKKRLTREDEEEQDGSDDEDDKRINFSGVKNKSQRQKIAEEIGIEGSDDEALDTGHDEELSRWEQEQIRKGISIPQVQSNPPEDNTAYYQNSYETQPYGASYNMPYTYSTVTPAAAVAPAALVSGPVPYSGPAAELAPVSSDLVKKRLRDRLGQMRTGHEANAKRYDQIVDELTASDLAIHRLEGSSNDNAEQYKFLQEMRGYVGDLLECFGEKVPTILELESAMHQLLRQRAARLVQRRQDDIKDESAEFASLSSKAVMAPSLDSFGRDRTAYQEHARQRRIAEREARRTRRRQAREQDGKRAEHREGLSSDDEETSTDITSFDMERDRIVRECKKVFEDAVEDFHSLDFIKARFEVWRRDYVQCYREAYIGLCLPKLFNPLVRLQLITWSPLQAECANFEYMLWFESLLFYGCEEQGPLRAGDVDVNLLPAIVEKVLISKLSVLAEQVWDPLSSSQTARLVGFIRRLTRSYPTVLHGDNRYTEELLKAVLLRTRRSLDEDVFLPLYPKNVLENKNGGPYLFYERQFWSCVKLLGNILQFEGILSSSCVRELALDSTLNRYILSALQTTDSTDDSVLKCQQLVLCFPAQWFTGMTGQKTLPQLEPLCRYLTHVASTLYRGSLAASDLERRSLKDQIKEVVKMLGQMNALDHIITVATEHGIKDIKPLLEAK